MAKSSSRVNTSKLKDKYHKAFRGVKPKILKVYGETELSPVLQRLASRTNTKIVDASIAGAEGAYDPRKNTIYVEKATVDKELTIIHELGHAKDFEKSMRPRKSWKSTFTSLPQSEKNKIIVSRYNRYVDPEDRVKTIAQVSKRVDKEYFAYMKSSKEVFADGYAQFIKNAKSIRSTSPTIYNYFQSIKTI